MKIRKVLFATNDALVQCPTFNENTQIFRVDTISKVFPVIFANKPDLIFIDYDCFCKETENLIRRIRTNRFYDSMKICCFKDSKEIRTDTLLKAIGTDYFIYRKDSF
jgi:hypothetical protein